MSETLHNRDRRKALLKHMIRQLHDGEAPEQVREKLVRMLGQVPYGDVVEVEQELMAEGMPQEEILKLCDVHAEVLRGNVERPEELNVPAGHPVHVFQEENRALMWEVDALEKAHRKLGEMKPESDATELFHEIRTHFFAITDVEKHYQRKENLLFPFLEQHGITGPSTVMWGKHDEVREWLKAGGSALEELKDGLSAADLSALVDMALKPAWDGISDMVYKEEEILLPMAMENLTDGEWAQVHVQTLDYGYCIVEPESEWEPAVDVEIERNVQTDDRIRFQTGSLSPEELEVILNTIPFDMTVVDADDTVRYFTRGKERIFARSRAIIGRKVQRCHPPKSVDTVERILADFKAGRQEQAAFWIQLGGKFIHIEYFAMRDSDRGYLGTLEVSQDLTAKRALEGEQRLLSYDEPGTSS